MLKRDEVIKPTSCFNLAVPDELLFVLLSRDAAAPDTVRFWAGMRVSLGLNEPGDAQIKSAMETADLMDEQRAELRAMLDKPERASRTPAEGDARTEPE